MDTQGTVSLNINVRGLAQSATLGIKNRCRQLRAEGRNVFDFGLGQSPFPVPAPVVDQLREHAPQKDYLPVEGLPELRKTVADYHRVADGLSTSEHFVLVGPGSKELLFLLQVVFYGEVMLAPPCWVSYWPQARILGRRLSLVHSTFETGWKISGAKLDESIRRTNDTHRPRLLILNYPSNPTGAAYTADELRELAEVARKYRVIVLSDEIYGRLNFRDQHVSIARFFPEGTIVSSGLSKWCGAGGWRLGTFTFPEKLKWLATAMATVASETFTSVSAPIQYAACRAFRYDGEIQTYVAHVRRILSALAERIVPPLREAGIRVTTPDGGFYLFLDFSEVQAALADRGIRNGQALCEQLLADANIAMLPGSAFGRSRGDLTARLAFVDFDGTRALAASETIGLDAPLPQDFLDHHCAHLLEGIRSLAAWAMSTGRSRVAPARPVATS